MYRAFHETRAATKWRRPRREREVAARRPSSLSDGVPNIDRFVAPRPCGLKSNSRRILLTSYTRSNCLTLPLPPPLNQKIGGALFIADKYYQSYDYDGELEEIVITGYSSRKKTEYKPEEIEFKPIKVETEVTIKFKID